MYEYMCPRRDMIAVECLSIPQLSYHIEAIIRDFEILESYKAIVLIC